MGLDCAIQSIVRLCSVVVRVLAAWIWEQWTLFLEAFLISSEFMLYEVIFPTVSVCHLVVTPLWIPVGDHLFSTLMSFFRVILLKCYKNGSFLSFWHVCSASNTGFLTLACLLSNEYLLRLPVLKIDRSTSQLCPFSLHFPHFSASPLSWITPTWCGSCVSLSFMTTALVIVQD